MIQPASRAALSAHAQALIELRRLDEAEQTLAEAEALRPSTRDSTLIVATSRGDLDFARGDWARAALAYAESAAAAQSLRSTEQLVLDLQSLALALIELGDAEGALELEAAAAAIEAETGECGLEATAQAGSWDERRREARRAVGSERASAAAARGRRCPRPGVRTARRRSPRPPSGSRSGVASSAAWPRRPSSTRAAARFASRAPTG